MCVGNDTSHGGRGDNFARKSRPFRHAIFLEKVASPLFRQPERPIPEGSGAFFALDQNVCSSYNGEKREGGSGVELLDKLTILADAAKYDAACTSSGLDRSARPGGLGSTMAAGCCHTFSADGRCVTLLKVLLTNRCAYDCAYCVNRRSNDLPRAAFTPRELAELTIAFYRRNYIEGLFLSSAVWGGPDRTTEAMIETLRLLREGVRLLWLHPRQGHPGGRSPPHPAAGAAGRPPVRQHRAAQRGEPQPPVPRQGQEAILAPMAQIRDGIRGEPRRAGKIPPRPPVCPGGPVHPDDHRSHAGERQAYPHPHPSPLRQVPAQAGVLLGLHAGVGQRPPPRPGGFQAAPAAGAPAVPGGLAAAVLPLPGGGAAGRRGAQLRPPGGSQVLLGPAAPGLLPGGGSTGPITRPCCGCPASGCAPPGASSPPGGWGPSPSRASKPWGWVLKRAQYFLTCSGKMLEGLRVNPDGVLRHLGGPGEARPGGRGAGAAVPV